MDKRTFLWMSGLTLLDMGALGGCLSTVVRTGGVGVLLLLLMSGLCWAWRTDPVTVSSVHTVMETVRRVRMKPIPPDAELEMLFNQVHGNKKNNPAEALALLRQCAARDHPQALYELGVAYSIGSLGLSRDEDKGMASYHRAALLGNGLAQRSLARVFLRKKEHALAGYWFVVAWEQGDTSVKKELEKLDIPKPWTTPLYTLGRQYMRLVALYI